MAVCSEQPGAGPVTACRCHRWHSLLTTENGAHRDVRGRMGGGYGRRGKRQRGRADDGLGRQCRGAWGQQRLCIRRPPAVSCQLSPPSSSSPAPATSVPGTSPVRSLRASTLPPPPYRPQCVAPDTHSDSCPVPSLLPVPSTSPSCTPPQALRFPSVRS